MLHSSRPLDARLVQGLRPATSKSYRKAFSRLVHWVNENRVGVSTYQDYDAAVAAYSKGQARAKVETLVAALERVLPEVKG